MSSRELILRYVRERSRLNVFLPLALAMAAQGSRAQDIAPVNSGANPYKVIRDWAQLTKEERPWAAIGIAVVVLTVWYRIRPSARAVFNAHVVLLKYPLIAFAASPSAPAFGALVSLYLVLCAYEIVDDPSLRASIPARWIAASECALVSVIIATATLLKGRIS